MDLTITPTALYRLLAENGRLLYVGITNNPAARWKAHTSTKTWWQEVADTKLEWFPDRETAAIAEVKAINAERPLYNRQHSTLATHEAADSAQWGTPAAGPKDISAEQIVLGCAISDGACVAELVNIVEAVDFWRPAHTTLFDTILAIYSTGSPVDPMAVAAELAGLGALRTVGGLPYLRTLIGQARDVQTPVSSARVVRELAVRRRLIEHSLRLAHMGYAADLASLEGTELDPRGPRR